jgi:AcrR family transcriptional regulator
MTDPAPSPVDRPAPGLRERKKARTRAAIQRHAIRLFRERGYEETTISQIAEAVEISESTFFRYFPTKESVVLWDAFDPAVIAAFRAQPPEVRALPALRASARDVFARIDPAERRLLDDRLRLMASEPALRAAALAQFAGTVQMIAGMVAERAGRRAGDMAVQALAGAIIGLSTAAMAAVEADPSADFVAVWDALSDHLEEAMSL